MTFFIGVFTLLKSRRKYIVSLFSSKHEEISVDFLTDDDDEKVGE